MIPEYFAYATVIISLGAMYSYVRSMLRGKARPNRVTWILWGLAPMIACYIGYHSGVSIPVLASTFMAGFISIPIVLLSFFIKNGYWKTTRLDIWCGILSVVAIIIWVLTKNGVVSLLFAILADLFAGIPTMIKSWKHSETENAGSFMFGIVNQAITFLIIKNFSFINFAFPLYVIIANTIIVLGIKKKYILKLFS